jgi:hypothetical protein
MTDTNTPEQAAWLTLREAGEAVGVSSMTVRRAVKAGAIVGQKGDGPSDPWMVRSFDVEARWGRGTPPNVPAPGHSAVDATLAPQIETLAQLLNDALKAEGDARERAARAEAENEHLKERLAELRQTKPEPEPEKPAPKARRQWWPLRRNR